MKTIDYIKSHEPMGYYCESMNYYIDIYGIEYEYGNDIVYFTATYESILNGSPAICLQAHKARVYYNKRGDDYFMYQGHRIPLNKCLRYCV